MTEPAYTDEADDWEYQQFGPAEASEPAASGYIEFDSRKPNEMRRKLSGLVKVRRVIRPSAEVRRPTVGDKRLLEVDEVDKDGEVKVRRWMHETLFVPLMVNGRSTAELAGAPAHQFASWQQDGKVSKRDAARHQQFDSPWSLEHLANREIVWHMTQELPPEAGWRDRWDALGEGRKRQEHIVAAHLELAFELLAVRK
ncbi:MAG TPA: hypothetical protein VMW80_05265 [Candidatus Dormibacteraeota bacterium]|nr:hypothetical protein [Candidatus Dormibacteraeota bacterium]